MQYEIELLTFTDAMGIVLKQFGQVLIVVFHPCF